MWVKYLKGTQSVSDEDQSTSAEVSKKYTFEFEKKIIPENNVACVTTNAQDFKNECQAHILC